MGSTAPTPRGAPRPRRPRGPSIRQQRAEAVRFRRSLTLVGLSVVAPGSAQFALGNRKVGKIALSIWAGLVGVTALVLWLVPATSLAKLALRPWLLTSFKVLAFVVAIGWVAMIVDAWRLSHPPALNQKHRLIMVGATLALAGLVSTPFVVASRYATAAHDAVVEMFPSGDVAAASDGRLNILLLGGDAGDDRVGLRPDSIHLVSVDVRTGKPVMISLPRNLEKARFPDGTPAAEEFPSGFGGEGDRSDFLLNATWTYGEEHPDLFPGDDGPGATAVQQAVAGTLGIDIHYYVVVDLNGFRDLVDALGGITLRVNEELPIGDKGKVLEPGLQELDGYHALWYARSRESSSDYARMARQRCVLGAFLREADPQTVLTNFVELADASKAMMETDIPRESLADLVDLALSAKEHPITSLQFVPPLITPGDPDVELIRAETDAVLSGTAETHEPGAAPETADDTPSERPAEKPSDNEKGDDEKGDGGGRETSEGGDAGAEPSHRADEGDGEPVDVADVCAYE